ncbi:MAG: ABC transporter substrate-binding protein [Caldilineae bacterium]|nr:MAG: ABC transporter substrate-binding protein [Caldilineae bacterium]
MTFLSKHRVFLVLSILSVFLLAACAAPAAPAAPAEAPAAQPTEAPAEAPAPAAGPTTLRVTFAWPTFIDPAVGNDFSSSSSLINLYDTLVFPSPDGGIVPWLAESWDVSDDGLSYTFHLKQGVKFHDGSELTASDVVYSFNRLKGIGEGFAYMLADAESAEAVDDYTVTITLGKPSGLFLPSLLRLFIVNEDLVRANTAAEGPYGENGDYGKEWLLTHDAGSGPYKVKEFQLEEYLLMEKNEDWWGEFAPNAPDEIRFIGTTEAATIRTLMANRELEISDQWQTVQALEALDEIEGVDIAALPTMTEFYFMINTKIPPTDDVHCRRAMAWAFDYDTAVGLEWPGTRQSQGPVPASLGGHNPDVFVFHRDLEKAKEELAQCKYADEIENYPVEIHWVSEVPDEEKFALLFQSNMAEIGIPVKVVSIPWLSMVENTSSMETSPHIATIYVSSDLPEAGTMLFQRYHSSTANQWLQNEWLLDEEFDARIEDALATVDQEERFAKYYELQDYIAELAPSLFIYDQAEKHAYQSYVDWPALRGEMSAVMGYYFFGPQIQVNPH